MLVGKGPSPQATDTERKHVDTTTNFTREMARYADDGKAATNIGLDGFADDYLPHDGRQKPTIEGDDTNVDHDIEAFKDHTDDEYTDYAEGSDDAVEVMSNGTSDYKTILLFSDSFSICEAGSAGAVVRDVC